jgi:coenzyme PQQ synthesis protein D (PqqD)
VLNPGDRYRPNPDGVVAEVVDGEAIILNLVNGSYYSLDQVGGRIWTLLDEQRPLEQIVKAVASEYAVTLDQARADLERLLAELLDEQLIVTDAESTESAGPPTAPTGASRLPYSQPHLQVFHQMAELLALDPPMPSLQEIPWRSPGSGPST